jgi:Uncharacterized protein conserved in archaea (DUF2180)
MKCFVCARTNEDAPAVAVCPHCNAGLCLAHVAETARDPGPGGMRLSCGHGTWDPAWQPMSHARRPQEGTSTRTIR